MSVPANFSRRLVVSFPTFNWATKWRWFSVFGKNLSRLPNWMVGMVMNIQSLFQCIWGDMLPVHRLYVYKALIKWLSFDELSTVMINNFALRAYQWIIPPFLSPLPQLGKKICCWLFTKCPGLTSRNLWLCNSSTAKLFSWSQKIRAFKKIGLASAKKTQTSDGQKLLAQVKHCRRSRGQTIAAFDSHQSDLDESEEMQWLVTKELQQIVIKQSQQSDRFFFNFANIIISLVLIEVGGDTHNVTATRI